MELHGNDLYQKKRELCKKLCEIGCCSLCVLRFLGETNSGVYYTTHDTRTIEGFQDIISSIDENTRTCVACLGLLQKNIINDIISKIGDEVLMASGYDCKLYNVALNLPVNIQLRAHSLFLFISEIFSETVKVLFPGGIVTITVKDVFKWIACPILNGTINKQSDPNALFVITVSLTQADNDEESKVLKTLRGPFPNRFKTGRHLEPSRKSTDFVLKTISNEEFCKSVEIPPKILSEPVILKSVTLQHSPIFFAGRYNKLTRDLPQTAWIIEGKRKIESSVSECIGDQLIKFASASAYKFSSSGREDVDVRMLGRGRPFSIELSDPHRTVFVVEEIAAIQEEINKTGFGKVAVRDLQIVNKQSLINLKQGEESKHKLYCALCVVNGPLPTNLSNLPTFMPLAISQQTPIRVLHRRPLANREKTIYKLTATPVSDQKDGQGPSFFKIIVETQAGTYIKEFVHGDIGRTRPKLGDFLGDIDVDIVALDVEEVFLDWPPPLSAVGSANNGV